jgi:hypothetical protein
VVIALEINGDHYFFEDFFWSRTVGPSLAELIGQPHVVLYSAILKVLTQLLHFRIVWQSLRRFRFQIAKWIPLL